MNELGREPEMQAQSPLALDPVTNMEKSWNALRENNEAFDGQRDRWAFCASEVLYPDSLFFLGLNPSEPRGHLHTRFRLKELMEYGGIFDPLRKLAAKMECAYSYFDLFCFRRSKAADLHPFLPKLLETEDGRLAVCRMVELARQAIMTARPKAIYVCNGTARETLRGKRNLAKWLRGAGLATAFFFASPPPIHLPFFTGKKKMHFYYTVTRMSGETVPVLLGMGRETHSGHYERSRRKDNRLHCANF